MGPWLSPQFNSIQPRFNIALPYPINHMFTIYKPRFSQCRQWIERLSNHQIADQEIGVWKRHRFAQNEDSRPSTLATSLKECKKLLPNLYALLKIGCTLPVTSCQCEIERNMASDIIRTSMSSQRLSALAIMNINQNDSINYTEIVIKIFILHPRKFSCANLDFSE